MIKDKNKELSITISNGAYIIKKKNKEIIRISSDHYNIGSSSSCCGLGDFDGIQGIYSSINISSLTKNDKSEIIKRIIKNGLEFENFAFMTVTINSNAPKELSDILNNICISKTTWRKNPNSFNRIKCYHI